MDECYVLAANVFLFRNLVNIVLYATLAPTKSLAFKKPGLWLILMNGQTLVIFPCTLHGTNRTLILTKTYVVVHKLISCTILGHML